VEEAEDLKDMPGERQGGETGDRDETIGRVAGNLILLIPLIHNKVISRGRGISGKRIAGHRVLGVLIQHGPLPISDVGRRLYISKPYMTRLVDDLIAEGLVERLPDTTDRRIIRIQVTDEGRKRLRDIGNFFRDDIRDLFSDLSDGDMRLLDESLANLNRIIGNIPDCAPP
jgi:DNA-binding MarR family transcriptional regulator